MEVMVDDDKARMTLGEHFEELRKSLLRALLGIAVGMTVCLIFGDRLIEMMCWPVAVAERANDMPVRLRALAPMESFTVYLKICLIWGAILAAPYSLWQIWRFVAVGLYPHERQYVHRYVPFSVLLFAAGVAFFFVVIAPVGLSYLLGFGKDFPMPPTASLILRAPANSTPTATQPAGTQPAPARIPVLDRDPDNPQEGQVWITGRQICFKAGDRIFRTDPASADFLTTDLTLGFYMTFISSLSLAFGVGFQVPIVVMVLAKTGLVKVERLRKLRKYVILVVVVVAGVITPDPTLLSQLGLAIPMYLLYELGLLLSRPKKVAAPAA